MLALTTLFLNRIDAGGGKAGEAGKEVVRHFQFTHGIKHAIINCWGAV